MFFQKKKSCGFCSSQGVTFRTHFWTMVLEKTLESPLNCKEIQPVNPKGNQSWIFIGRKDWGLDGWMASPTRWTWVWASSGSWWWTGKPGVLQSMGLQRVRHDWVAELNWTWCQVVPLLVVSFDPLVKVVSARFFIIKLPFSFYSWEWLHKYTS